MTFALLHGAAAFLLKTPEFGLSQEEAYQLAKCMTLIKETWGWQVSPKGQAATVIISSATAIYGPRFAIVGARWRAARAQAASRVKAPPHGFAGPSPRTEQPAPQSRQTQEAPPAPTADSIVRDMSGAVVFTTGMPDGGKIDFGG